MKLVYAIEDPPEEFTLSIFLVGPTPRSRSVPSWRPEMIQALEEAGYGGVVFIPESPLWTHSYEEQVEWEHQCLNMSDIVIAWVPRDLRTLPAFTTNVEFGMLLRSGKLFYGRPDGAEKTRYLDYCYEHETGRAPTTTIRDLARQVVGSFTGMERHVDLTAPRRGGCRSVPWFVWQSEMFQDWYWRQTREAGNRLDDVRLLWTYMVGPEKDILFCFTLWVKVWIAAEERWKENEFVFSRPDVACVVAFHQDRSGGIEILLVKEFRSPARTKDGYVHELPGGSSREDIEPRQLAAKELGEETGLEIAPTRLQVIGRRQLLATLSSHAAMVFAVMLTDDEKEQLLTDREAHGIEEDTERTYTEMRNTHNLLWSEDVDWSSLGMILAALDHIRVDR